MSTVRPVHELSNQTQGTSKDPSATRWGWSALMNIDLSDRTGSRRVGLEAIPARELVMFETVTVDRPAELESSFKDFGTHMEVESERADNTAQQCAYWVYKDCSEKGFTRFEGLIGRSDAESIYQALYPVKHKTLKQALDYLASEKPDAVVESFTGEAREAAKVTLAEQRLAAEKAWAYANDTLDQSETEMRERAAGASKGKKKYDAHDLYLYGQTERVKPEFQAAQATVEQNKAVGTAIADALSANRSDDRLAEVVSTLAEGQLQLAENQRRTDERLAAQQEQTNQILSLIANKLSDEKPKKDSPKR